MKVQITLKNGVQIDFEAEELTKTSNRITHEMTGLEWTAIDGRPKLFHIDLGEVAAIVTTPTDADAA